MNASTDTEVKKIYEKSIRLLNDKQARLMDMRQVLKKAVIRLSLTARDDNDRLNAILKDINVSVSDHIDIDLLSQHLDKLFVLINHDDFESRSISSDNSESSKVSSGDSNLNHVLNEIVNQISLPSVSREEQVAITDTLNAAVDDDSGCNDIAKRLVVLVNSSINAIEQEKQELEIFVTKISMQLTDIGSFMRLMNDSNDDSIARSQALTDSIESGVSDIEDSVEKSSDLCDLKKNVAKNLNGIRERVKDYKVVDQQATEQSSEQYQQILQELNRAQEESALLKEQLHESKALLLRDPLTGIPNRLAFEERVALEVSRWQRSKAPLCIAIWDIDFFKKINDTYGHGVGDRVLKLFAEIIQNRIRKVDMFARIGGEEFVLLMPDTPISAALTLNDKLRVLLEECNFRYEGEHCRITASVGLSEFIEGDEVAETMDRADKALYQSKNGGRNRCTVYATSTDQV